MSSYSSIENQYNQQQEEDYQEFLEFKERRDREKGILPEGFAIGDTLHPKTVKSYSKLGLPTPDSVYYASRRHTERMLKMCKALAAEKGEKFEVKKTITTCYRLKDNENGKEYMAWNEFLSFKDRMDNVHTLDYSRCGTHPEAIGNVRKDIHMKVIGGEVTEINNVFDKEWSPKAFEELMKEGGKKETQYIIGFTKNGGKGSTIISNEEKPRSIKCADDFKTAKFEELWELSRRGLSGKEPSLSRLKQPISQDGANSLAKQERFFVNPNAISYVQETYQ